MRCRFLQEETPVSTGGNGRSLLRELSFPLAGTVVSPCGNERSSLRKQSFPQVETGQLPLVGYSSEDYLP
ncbi:hypothetical protein [uncultured Bacteroides sp.]|uniref:hypothetical protein n=1 Tax=uncultured Bacteroides sp. TaxID=162156 RepID=UPI00280BDF04|nr:hypothetical protein [uncultured Bacteroides sp.]